MKKIKEKKRILILGGLALLAVVFAFADSREKTGAEQLIRPVENIACTEEARVCPDGSFVARSGPSCEFAECPDRNTPPVQKTSGIRGSIFIGPTCPVVQNLSEENCYDKRYQGTVVVEDTSGNEVDRITSDKEGDFVIVLAPGDYRLVPVSPGVYPQASPVTATVHSGEFSRVMITYDSGIR